MCILGDIRTIPVISQVVSVMVSKLRSVSFILNFSVRIYDTVEIPFTYICYISAFLLSSSSSVFCVSIGRLYSGKLQLYRSAVICSKVYYRLWIAQTIMITLDCANYNNLKYLF